MLRNKIRSFKTHPAISLESLVPNDNFYRQLEGKLDLSFVRDLVAELYSALGRPAIDPIVFFKLQLIMFFEGIRSERQLMEAVQLNLAYRWYIGYDLDERVPDHSSLSKIRDRYGLKTFQKFFEKIIELCQAAGLVWGKELYFDGTKVRANADIDKRVPRFYWEAKRHLAALFEGEAEAEKATQARPFIEKYNGQRLLSGRSSHQYARQSDSFVCPTDPNASPLYKQFGSSRLGYHLHYVVDGGKARIILAALVSPASIQDNTPMLDLERWIRFRWRIQPKIAVGDSKYGTVPNIVGLEQDGLQAYLALADYQKRSQTFSYRDFRYDAQTDSYTCPAGQNLPLSSYDRYTESFIYRTSAKICTACPIKARCTSSSYARVVKRSIHQDYIDRVYAYHATEEYKKAQRKRSVWIEPMFAEAKVWHQMMQFRLRGLVKVNIQALMVASGQNIKRLLKAKQLFKPQPPAQSQILQIRRHFGGHFLCLRALGQQMSRS